MRVPFNDFGLVFDRPQHRFEVPYSFKVGGGPIPPPLRSSHVSLLSPFRHLHPGRKPSRIGLLGEYPSMHCLGSLLPCTSLIPCTALIHSFPALPCVPPSLPVGGTSYNIATRALWMLLVAYILQPIPAMQWSLISFFSTNPLNAGHRLFM